MQFTRTLFCLLGYRLLNNSGMNNQIRRFLLRGSSSQLWKSKFRCRSSVFVSDTHFLPRTEACIILCKDDLSFTYYVLHAPHQKTKNTEADFFKFFLKHWKQWQLDSGVETLIQFSKPWHPEIPLTDYLQHGLFTAEVYHAHRLPFACTSHDCGTICLLLSHF